MSIKKIAEQDNEKKFLVFALVSWVGISVVIGVLIALMVIGPGQTFFYFLWGVFDISIVVFAGLGIMFVPFLVIDLVRILSYKKKILPYSKVRDT